MTTNSDSAKSRQAVALSRRHMPTDYAISLAKYTNRGTPEEPRIPKDFGPRQTLAGFEETYRNIIDYIVRITYRIWEDRDVEYIRDTYDDASRVYDDYGLQLGSAKIVDDTYHTTGAFSDIELIADEIVWAGDDEVGFHTSHRTIVRGTNDGPSRYGPATGRMVDVLVFANCVALENEIFLEHVIYNTSSMLNQLGFDIGDMARKLAANPPAGWPRYGLGVGRAACCRTSGNAAIDRRTGFRVRRRPLRPSELRCLVEPPRFWCADGRLRARLLLPGANGPGVPGHKPRTGACWGHSLPRFPIFELQVDEVYWMGNEFGWLPRVGALER